MNPSSDDRIADLTKELARVEREIAQLRQANPAVCRSGPRRWSRLQTAVPGLLLGAWVLSAGAPPSQDDLEQRVSDLEARLMKGPGTTTRIQAPFEIVGGGGNVILQVTQAMPTLSNGVGIFTQGKIGGVIVTHDGQDIAGLGTADGGKGGLLYIADENGVSRAEVDRDGVDVKNGGGETVVGMYTTGDEAYAGRVAILNGQKIIATLEGSEDGGVLDISNGKGKTRAQLGVDDDNGYISTFYKGKTEVEMGTSDKGEPQLSVSDNGKLRAALRVSAGAGHLSLANAKDLVVANVTATGSGDGGAVIVGNGSGKGVASLESGADGRGMVQIFQPGAGSVAVLTQDTKGGQLQIKNDAGIPVANFKSSEEGDGFWQLTNTAGVPTVEAGTDEENRGLVRVGPYHTCTPAMGTALVGVAMLPDCIRGRNKQ
jgi:hypothetical protein